MDVHFQLYGSILDWDSRTCLDVVITSVWWLQVLRRFTDIDARLGPAVGLPQRMAAAAAADHRRPGEHGRRAGAPAGLRPGPEVDRQQLRRLPGRRAQVWFTGVAMQFRLFVFRVLFNYNTSFMYFYGKKLPRDCFVYY